MSVLLIVSQVPAGLFLADLLTACIHLAVDGMHGRRWERLPLVGGTVRAFYLHHLRPAHFLRHSFWYSNAENLLGGALLAAAACFFMPWLLGSLAVGVALAQESHRWAHRKRRPAPVRWLQVARLMLPPAAHAVHHAAFDRHYSVLNGWSNPILNALLRLARRARA